MTRHPEAFRAKMERDDQSELAIRAFLHGYETLFNDVQPTIAEESIAPVEHLPELKSLPHASEHEGHDLLPHTLIIKLNGGLGTGMGLEKAKSLLPVRSGQTFLDLIARQILHLRRRYDSPLRFMLMSSFSTAEDTAAFLAKYPELGRIEDLQFHQSRVPKVDLASGLPAEFPTKPDLEWCPPGHGDLYASFAGSGWLDNMLEQGVIYAFVSNSDNLGATLDLDLLRYFAASGHSFLMEVTRRTAADKKGGHLALDRAGGHLLLRESAQCAKADEEAFQDIRRHRYFNTNNLWLRLDALKAALAKDGFLPLAVIKNRKPLDPRDAHSTPVIQLETAMGAAISCLENASAVAVPRSRFAPVKTTDDLLALRSDAYRMTEDYRLELAPERQGHPPAIHLDPKHYKLVDQFERLVAEEPPSLIHCHSLKVSGPIAFKPGVIFEGDARLHHDGPHVLALTAGKYSGKWEG